MILKLKKVVKMMSNYTTQLRFICETEAGKSESVGYSQINEVIQAAIPKVFSFDFPIFDESYRNVLCTKILKHYYTREIGEETYGLWKLRLETRLNEIMPFYNEFYKSTVLDFNPLYDTDLTTTHEGSSGGENNSSNSDKNKTVNKYSDTPQGALDNVESGRYLTNATINEYQNNANANSKYSDTNEYITHVKGKGGGKTYPEMLKEFRDNIVNVDMMVIGDLSDLFILLW